MDAVLCERRESCALNDNGVCRLKEPMLDKRAAYVSCLSQIKPVGSISLTKIGKTPIGLGA